jgi:hypothetical protein
MTTAKSSRAPAKKASDAIRPRATKAKTGPTDAPAKAETDLVLKLLRRRQGAVLAELIEATGWLPHTTRAALTGLRKKGNVLEKTRRNDASCYRITAA